MMTTPAKKQLPTGIQTFEKIRKGNYYYVDKTPLMLELLKETAVFLSRPRRFGKSLTLSTIDALFSGKKELFTGLYAEHNWDWSQTNPVIRLSFGSGSLATVEKLTQSLKETFDILQKQFNTTLTSESPSGRFKQLIHHCYAQTGRQVVILIDEYDKPMLDNLHRPEQIVPIREELRGLYSVIKDNDEFVRFAMLTGVSKFSKVNLFSGLNNLDDITLDKKYSALCGYTQTELETVFEPELEGVELDKLKDWYNGYNWTGEPVYNPFDILLFLSKRVYKNYWFETGTPTFLLEQMVHFKKTLFDIDKGRKDGINLAQFDVGNFEPISLMFQAGYLTIDKMIETEMGASYTLKYPNKEVRQSLNEAMLYEYVSDRQLTVNQRFELFDSLNDNDIEAMERLLRGLFQNVPYNWYCNNTIAHYEGHWASMFYAFFASIGVEIVAEDVTNKGRIDMTVKHKAQTYIFEFKVVEIIDQTTGEINQKYPIGEAIKQLKAKKYADKYQALNKPIYLIGVEFSEHSREIVNFEVEVTL